MDIYLDNAASTRCDPQVARVAMDVMTGEYGNPSSLHSKGLAAQLRLDAAREQVAKALGCTAGELLFTSGGTEANNLAILGAARARQRRGQGIVAMSTAHASVLEPLARLGEQGFSVTLVDPLPDGNPDLTALTDAVDGHTILLCCDFVGSEVGAVLPVQEFVRTLRRKNKELFIHCDGVQALGKVAFAAGKLGVDSLSVSGHKIFAPKGVGALYLRRNARILPLMWGGGQERGLRPGTENVPLACAFGEAARLAAEQREQRLNAVQQVFTYFMNKIETMPGVCINSPPDATPYISNLSLPGYRSETMLHHLAARGVYLSSGSACSRGAASHVLTAMKLPLGRVDSALRVSLCPDNTREHIDLLTDALEEGMRILTRSKP